MDRSSAADAAGRIVDNVCSVILGKRDVVEASVIALADGHLLLEDAPGVGKTVLAKSIARSIDGLFKRVQATPDLLPSDITGVAIYQQKTQEFVFVEGPIFANVVVTDEINRTTPRTQAAMLEAMEERQVTAEGQPRALPHPFFVIATQNPLEHHGTYPLPEGQLDRFLIATSIGYAGSDVESAVINDQLLEHPLDRIGPVATLEEVVSIQTHVKQTHVAQVLVDYAVAIVSATREHPDLTLGASPRGSLHLVRAAQARALVRGRQHILPDDIKAMAPLVLGHRLVLRPQLRAGPLAGRGIVAEVLERVPVPVS